MIYRTRNGSLWDIVYYAKRLANIDSVTNNTGYYLLAGYNEGIVEICVDISKSINNETGNYYYLIYIVCGELFDTYWSDWEYTETDDPEELFNKLKEIRDNLTEEDFKKGEKYD